MIKINKSVSLLLTTLTAIVAFESADAEILFTEHFDTYEIGSISNITEYTYQQGDCSYDIVATNIQYSSGDISIDGGEKAMLETAPRSNGIQNRFARVFNAPTTNTAVYVSYILQPAHNSGNGFIVLGVTGPSEASETIIDAGYAGGAVTMHNCVAPGFVGSADSFRVRVGSDIANTATRSETKITNKVAVKDSPSLVVFKVLKSGQSGNNYDTAMACINPNSTNEATAGTWFSTSVKDSGLSSLGGYYVRSSKSNPEVKIYIDEVRVGTRFEDVVSNHDVETVSYIIFE